MNFDDKNNLVVGSYYQNNYSAEENQQFTKEFAAITEKMVACLDARLEPEHEKMQDAIRLHYEFCLRFWKPDRESYKNLAMSFALPTAYNETYEAEREGLGNYIYQAATIFADKNL